MIRVTQPCERLDDYPHAVTHQIRAFARLGALRSGSQHQHRILNLPTVPRIGANPVAPVSVTVGGYPATVLYAGAAPGYMPGVLQINAQMSPDAQAGSAVPVRITIGGVSSQDSVTLAVR